MVFRITDICLVEWAERMPPDYAHRRCLWMSFRYCEEREGARVITLTGDAQVWEDQISTLSLDPPK